MPSGTVRKFFKREGFGFIDPDDGSDSVFVHRKIHGDGKDYSAYLSEGLRVEYEVEWDARRNKYRASSCSGFQTKGASGSETKSLGVRFVNGKLLSFAVCRKTTFGDIVSRLEHSPSVLPPFCVPQVFRTGGGDGAKLYHDMFVVRSGLGRDAEVQAVIVPSYQKAIQAIKACIGEFKRDYWNGFRCWDAIGPRLLDHQVAAACKILDVDDCDARLKLSKQFPITRLMCKLLQAIVNTCRHEVCVPPDHICEVFAAAYSCLAKFGSVLNLAALLREESRKKYIFVPLADAVSTLEVVPDERAEEEEHHGELQPSALGSDAPEGRAHMVDMEAAARASSPEGPNEGNSAEVASTEEDVRAALQREGADVQKAILLSKGECRSADGVWIYRVTFHNPQVIACILESDIAKERSVQVEDAGCEVQPKFANGAILLVPLTHEQLRESGSKLGPHNIAMLQGDAKQIEEALLARFSRRKRPQLLLEYQDQEHSEVQEERDDRTRDAKTHDVPQLQKAYYLGDIKLEFKNTFLSVPITRDVTEASTIVCSDIVAGAACSNHPNPRRWKSHLP